MVEYLFQYEKNEKKIWKWGLASPHVVPHVQVRFCIYNFRRFLGETSLTIGSGPVEGATPSLTHPTTPFLGVITQCAPNMFPNFSRMSTGDALQ